ncbi:hypothetical protein [Mesorhizobium sp. M0589]|uniref:hypothetical protein n=1 Tax=Mesorhizobium sp. M0589 TaxID=2956965 RepID=UPI00333BFBE9
MDGSEIDKAELEPDAKKRIARAAINAVAGAIPFAGGLISAGSGYWSEKEQEEVTNVLRQWLQMLEDELREKCRTIAEIKGIPKLVIDRYGIQAPAHPKYDRFRALLIVPDRALLTRSRPERGQDGYIAQRYRGTRAQLAYAAHRARTRHRPV